MDLSRGYIGGPGFAWGLNSDIIYAGGGSGVRFPVDLDTLQPVSGRWIYKIADDAVRGTENKKDYTGIVTSVRSDGDQIPRIEVKNRWRNKGIGAKGGLLASKVRALLSSNKA